MKKCLGEVIYLLTKDIFDQIHKIQSCETFKDEISIYLFTANERMLIVNHPHNWFVTSWCRQRTIIAKYSFWFLQIFHRWYKCLQEESKLFWYCCTWTLKNVWKLKGGIEEIVNCWYFMGSEVIKDKINW